MPVKEMDRRTRPLFALKQTQLNDVIKAGRIIIDGDRANRDRAYLVRYCYRLGFSRPIIIGGGVKVPCRVEAAIAIPPIATSVRPDRCSKINLVVTVSQQIERLIGGKPPG